MQHGRYLGAQRRTLSGQAVTRTNAPVTVPSHRQTVAKAAAVEPETIPHSELLDNLFQDMCKHYDIDTLVTIGDSGTGGIGLFAKQDFAKGQTIIKVPRSICIVIDNDTGALTIPQGDWPRLSGGIMQEGEPLPWDILQGLALMDATAGDGDPFWELYAEHLLPPPEEVTLPMAWGPELLQQLQHEAIEQGAQAQQERLRTLLPPEYMNPIAPGLPSYLQWGFACVRSRALQLGQQAFGMVPFADIANHSADPNADTRAAPAAPTAAGSESAADAPQQQQQAAGGFVELLAVKDIPAGTEVTISYSGLQGYTNQRFMVQYGFVPAQGNPADRLELTVPDSLQGASFRLSYLEDALGAKLLMDAAQGKNPYLIAALKSLPVTADDIGPAQEAAAAAGAAAGTGRGLGPSTQQEKDLADALKQQVEAQLAQGSGSSLQEDEQLLQQLEEQQQQQGEVDVRLVAAVRYRVERKRLLQACQVLLNIFLRE